MPSEWLYYMVPIETAAWIRLIGILSYNARRKSEWSARIAKAKLPSIADPGPNQRRDDRPVGERWLHDFVPFYWTTHTAMQHKVIRKRVIDENDLCFMMCQSEHVLEKPGVWTTDGNAAKRCTNILKGKGAVGSLNMWILNSRDALKDEDTRRKMAEVLVPDHVPVEDIDQVAVVCPASKHRLEELTCMLSPKLGIDDYRPIAPKIEVIPKLYIGHFG